VNNNGVPEFLEQVSLLPDPGSGGVFRGEARAFLEGEITVLVECEAQSFPLERFCRFVRQSRPEAPYTFPGMEFATESPGLRVGPWPGWRGIPEFPRLMLTAGNATIFLKASFWGDEFATGVVRFVGTSTCKQAKSLAIVRPDPGLIPKSASLYRTSAVRATRRPVSLLRPSSGPRPLLLLYPGTVPKLSAAAGGSHKPIWQKILALLDHWELAFEITAESKTVPGPERLSHEDRVLLSAVVALLDPQRENVKRGVQAFRDYRRETRQPDFGPLRIDTQSGEILFILCLAYDWLWQFLPAGEKQEAREWLWQVAEICWGHLGYDRRDYGQAHYLGCGLGLLAFSFLFWNDHPRAQEWAAHLRGALDCALDLLPTDGSYPHGVNLWIYETGFLLRWIELLRSCTGEDLWQTTPALKQLSIFRAATLSPNGLYGITMGDPQYRVGGDSWCHYLIAARTGSSLAQRMGRILDELPHEGVDYRHVPPRRRIYEFLFYDPSIPAAEELPRLSWFGDTGQFCQRSATSLVTFRSGPPLGRQRYERGEYGGYGHSDPASGSFLLYRNGTFAVSGPGPVYRRDTALHNTITIDGAGQIGDSAVWMPDFIPPDRLAAQPEKRTDGRRVLLSAQLAQTYLSHLEVESHSRTLAIDLDRYILGVDSIRCRTPHLLQWNAHAWGPIHRSMEDGMFLFPGNTQLAFLAPEEVQVVTGMSEFVPAYPHDGTRDTRLVISLHAQEARFVWCFLMTDEPVPRVTEEESRLVIRFSNDRTVASDGQWLIPDDFHDSPS
jgi:hypothetical protein